MSAKNSEPWIKSTCAYCGVGCGIEARPTPGGQLEVRGDKDHPANYGRLCSKGLALGETVSHQGRQLRPSVDGAECQWDQALNYVAGQFSDIVREHGPEAVAFYVSGQLLTEDYYVANKLMKGFIGSSNIDSNSRLCMSSSVAGHKRAFGADCVPGCYQDLELADLIVLTGSNLAWCHPVLYQRLKAAKAKRPEVKVVVIDPRTTSSCEIADLHLAINPGSDIALFNGLLAYLAEHQKLDHGYIAAHTEGFDLALASARLGSGDNARLCRQTGLSSDQLVTFYQLYAETANVVTVYSQGVNQSIHGSDKVNSLLNCHLATGRIGKPGCGPFSVTGQPNAMGGREVGGLANMLAAHMEFGNDTHYRMISDFWQTNTLSPTPGLKAIEMFDAIDSGKIKAVWIMATNPAVSLPDSDKINRALEKCPLVVVSDCIADTDTTRHANVLLPAQGWSEKSGTVTNSERRISRQRRLLPTPGEGRPDWWIICEVAKKMGFGHAFSYRHEADIFSEYCEMTGLGNHGETRRELNLTGLAGLTPGQYHLLSPQQWPISNEETGLDHKRLFTDGLFATQSGKARFVAVQFHPPASRISKPYPLVLNTGRIRDQWHTMTRTGLSPRLGEHSPEPYVSIHPDDARHYRLANKQIAKISSRYGNAAVRVKITADVKPGELFIPIHWSCTTASAGKVCSLISPVTDNLSGQPEFKFTPVSITPFAYRSEALLVSGFLRDMTDYDYWTRQKIVNGYLYRIASHLSPKQLMYRLSSDCQHHNSRELRFSSNSNGAYRYASIVRQQLRSCYLIAESLDQQNIEWVYHLLAEPINDSAERSLLSGTAEGKLAGGKTICACKQISRVAICRAIQEQQLQTIEEIRACTQAGTGCGSCVPELRTLLDDQEKALPTR